MLHGGSSLKVKIAVLFLCAMSNKILAQSQQILLLDGLMLSLPVTMGVNSVKKEGEDFRQDSNLEPAFQAPSINAKIRALWEGIKEPLTVWGSKSAVTLAEEGEYYYHWQFTMESLCYRSTIHSFPCSSTSQFRGESVSYRRCICLNLEFPRLSF